MTSVFIIINEWTDQDVDFECIYGDQFWLSEAGALVRLEHLADQLNTVVLDGETSFDVPEKLLDGLERDTYYIRELTQR